jgi:cytochrome P450
MKNFQSFESIATTLSMTTLLIAMHPRVQQKLLNELQVVFESENEDVDDEKLNKLTYMELVIKESMRLWPKAPLVARYAASDIELGEKRRLMIDE